MLLKSSIFFKLIPMSVSSKLFSNMAEVHMILVKEVYRHERVK